MWLAIRLAFCGIIALLNGIAIGFQGNGNLLISGVFIGLFLAACPNRGVLQVRRF
jgi:uncharacterized membrane-anchored protein